MHSRSGATGRTDPLGDAENAIGADSGQLPRSRADALRDAIADELSAEDKLATLKLGAS